MIRHVPHKRIDREQWDRLLSQCPNRMWYAQSWVLDLTAPGWDALIDEERGAIMPLTWRGRAGIEYLFQPYGSQQLGVFAHEYSDRLGAEFINSIPDRFRFADIALNEAMEHVRADAAILSPLTQQVLPLARSVRELRAMYNTGTKRNLKKADGPHGISDDVDAQEFRRLFERTTARRFNSGTHADHITMQKVIEEASHRRQCIMHGLRIGGKLGAAACFMQWEGRSIFYKSAANDEGKAVHGMFRIVDHHIARFAGSGLLLDFAGSNTPSVARFNAGFGARSRIYLRLQFNRLPLFLRWLKH